MDSKSIAEQINSTVENIWIMLEKEERTWMTFKLNNQQHVLLTLIIRFPSSSPSELADKMGITKSAVSQQLSKLERDGYIVKRQDDKDKRAFSIELGEKGLIYKSETENYYSRILDKYYSKLTHDELKEILSSLTKLKDIIGQVKSEEI